MYSILIVDDETIILEGIKEVIKESALPFKEIKTASSAEEALMLFEKEPYDILLMDISMPQMNGLELTAEMKKIWPYTEVIFLTGFQDFEYARCALRLHSFDYLLKPMPDEELLERLQAVITELDGRWKNRFVYDSDAIAASEKRNRELSEMLRLQMKQRQADFSELKDSGFAFDREQRLRILLFSYQTDQARVKPDVLHGWITEMLQKITYGYVCGFSAEKGFSVFLIQKASDSEEIFSGVYKALEEMQSHFYTKLDLEMMILVSHRTAWEHWIDLAEQMLERAKNMCQYGALYTYEEQDFEQDTDGNLLMYKIRDYIAANPAEDLSLGRLSQLFRMNPSYLSRSFHQTIQKPLSLYITGVRIEEAKKLLKESDDKIYEIARKVGFETQGYFTKVFAKVEGITPKEYRMNKCMDEIQEKK